MPITVTIKGLDHETWNLFKADAVRRGQTTAQHFTQLVKQHCNNFLREDPLKIMQDLRAKAGTWSGSHEVAAWRKNVNL